MATPESKVKNRTKQILDKLGVYHFSPQSGIYGRSGIPDIVACVYGRFVAIECKAGKNKPTALQEKEIEKINAAGGFAVWVNEETVERLMTVLSLMKLGGKDENEI